MCLVACQEQKTSTEALKYATALKESLASEDLEAAHNWYYKLMDCQATHEIEPLLIGASRAYMFAILDTEYKSDLENSMRTFARLLHSPLWFEEKKEYLGTVGFVNLDAILSTSQEEKVHPDFLAYLLSLAVAPFHDSLTMEQREEYYEQLKGLPPSQHVFESYLAASQKLFREYEKSGMPEKAMALYDSLALSVMAQEYPELLQEAQTEMRWQGAFADNAMVRDAVFERWWEVSVKDGSQYLSFLEVYLENTLKDDEAKALEVLRSFTSTYQNEESLLTRDRYGLGLCTYGFFLLRSDRWQEAALLMAQMPTGEMSPQVWHNIAGFNVDLYKASNDEQYLTYAEQVFPAGWGVGGLYHRQLGMRLMQALHKIGEDDRALQALEAMFVESEEAYRGSSSRLIDSLSHSLFGSDKMLRALLRKPQLSQAQKMYEILERECLFYEKLSNQRVAVLEEEIKQQAASQNIFAQAMQHDLIQEERKEVLRNALMLYDSASAFVQASLSKGKLSLAEQYLTKMDALEQSFDVLKGYGRALAFRKDLLARYMNRGLVQEAQRLFSSMGDCLSDEAFEVSERFVTLMGEKRNLEGMGIFEEAIQRKDVPPATETRQVRLAGLMAQAFYRVKQYDDVVRLYNTFIEKAEKLNPMGTAFSLKAYYLGSLIPTDMEKAFAMAISLKEEMPEFMNFHVSVEVVGDLMKQLVANKRWELVEQLDEALVQSVQDSDFKALVTSMLLSHYLFDGKVDKAKKIYGDLVGYKETMQKDTQLRVGAVRIVYYLTTQQDIAEAMAFFDSEVRQSQPHAVDIVTRDTVMWLCEEGYADEAKQFYVLPEVFGDAWQDRMSKAASALALVQAYAKNKDKESALAVYEGMEAPEDGQLISAYKDKAALIMQGLD